MTRELSLVQTSAGSGTRARPLSLYSPTTMKAKGMMNVMGLSIAEIQIAQARRWNVDNVYIVAKELENRDQLHVKFGNGSRFGMKIKYSHPLDDYQNNGSGDALLTNIERNNLQGDSLVLSNDNLFEFDLDQALRRHRDNDAAVTVLTIPMKPRDTIKTYGLIDVDENARITKLIEKPKNEKELMEAMGYRSERDLTTRTVHVNTAGYILNNAKLAKLAQTEEWIINGRKNMGNFDMAGVLLAGLAKKGLPLYVKAIEEWGDFGNLTNYLETTKRALGGAFRSIDSILFDRGYKQHMGSSWIHPDSLDRRKKENGKTLRERLNDEDLKIGPNVFVDEDAELGDGCIIRHTDIGLQASIGANSIVNNSIISAYSIVSENATFDRAILGASSYVNSTSENPTSITDGTAIGSKVKVPAGSNLRNSVIFPGYKFNGPETIVNETIEPTPEHLMELQAEHGKA